MAVKYYAVRKGKKPGIYRTWAECKIQVDGFSGAEYKSFSSQEEAQNFLAVTASKSSQIAKKKVLTAYVDGSYNVATAEFSYGMVLLVDGEERCFSQKVDDKKLAEMRNVAGEIKGAEAAMRYAVEHGYDHLILYHDYEGIAKWCLGLWKTNREGTKAYKKYFDSIQDRLSVTFEKVKGHSNDKYNDMADALAKSALQ